MEVSTHIKSFYNKNEFSDFYVYDSDNNKIYLHKIILSKNEFFKNYFTSTFNDIKINFKVENLWAASVLLRYVYGYSLNLSCNLDFIDRENFDFEIDSEKINDYIELLYLSRMWLMDDYVSDRIYILINQNIDKFLITIEMANILYLYFYDYKQTNTLSVPYFNEYARIISNNKILYKSFRYLEKNLHNITADMIGLAIIYASPFICNY